TVSQYVEPHALRRARGSTASPWPSPRPPPRPRFEPVPTPHGIGARRHGRAAPPPRSSIRERAMTQPTSRYTWTYAEYARFPDDGNRYEVIDGEVLVTPAPSPRHQYVMSN